MIELSFLAIGDQRQRLPGDNVPAAAGNNTYGDHIELWIKMIEARKLARIRSRVVGGYLRDLGHEPSNKEY
jgi:hypothetical protein